MARILIAGCGDVGTRLARELNADGHRIWGLRREVSNLPGYIRPIAADLRIPDSLEVPAGIDFLFYLPAAGQRSEALYRGVYVEGLQNLLGALQRVGGGLKRVFYISSTGVYGQRDGEWVDEASPTKPAGFSGKLLLEGEVLARSTAYPCTVVRFAGIYGPGRSRLLERVRGGGPCVAEPPQYTNRIHSDDCARALRHLLSLPQAADLYLAVDNEPAPQCVVMRWLSKQLGVAPPRAISAPEAGLPGSKRCSNRRLTETGFQFLYPTFRDGYAELLR